MNNENQLNEYDVWTNHIELQENEDRYELPSNRPENLKIKNERNKKVEPEKETILDYPGFKGEHLQKYKFTVPEKIFPILY